MPRVIDFTQGNETDWNEVRLPAPVLGTREISDEEIGAIADAMNDLVGGFEPQFSTYGKTVPQGREAEVYDAAHAWLSANTTGPWHWTEHWTNHGHHIDVAVYIERVPDQLAFAAAFQDLFGYRPAGEHTLQKLAVERGVLPPLTSKESFLKWSREHQGFEYLPYADLGEHGMRIAFSHPEIEAKFAERFGSRFTVEESEGRRAYAGSTAGTTRRDGPSAWLNEHSALGNMRSPGDGTWEMEVRYDDVAQALQRDWGHVFQPGEDGRMFRASDYPSSAPRELPSDFRAYIEGEADGYEAPYLPDELKAYREPAPTTSGLRPA